VSRETYSLLFNVIGTSFGVGDGSTTFNVPDIQDRAIYGQGSKVSLGGTEGAALGVRGPSHNHDLSGASATTAGAHSHGGSVTGNGGHGHSYNESFGSPTLSYNVADSEGTDYGGSYSAGIGGGDHGHGINADGDHTHPVTGGTTGAGSKNQAAFIGMVYVIVTGL
jgi:hypothetical protein